MCAPRRTPAPSAIAARQYLPFARVRKKALCPPLRLGKGRLCAVPPLFYRDIHTASVKTASAFLSQETIQPPGLLATPVRVSSFNGDEAGTLTGEVAEKVRQTGQPHSAASCLRFPALLFCPPTPKLPSAYPGSGQPSSRLPALHFAGRPLW